MAQNAFSLATQLYALMVEKVLLPNYLDNADASVKKEELRGIIDRYMRRLDRRIVNAMGKSFHINFGEKEDLINEIEQL